mgnify:CR=1 FL=1
MTPISQLTLAIFAPLVCGLATLALPRHAVLLRVLLALVGPVAAFTLLGMHIATHGVGGIDALGEAMYVAWMPELHLDLQLNPDRLGLFFALLVSGIGIAITIYARGYFGPDADSLYRFYPSLMLFMTAMIGVGLADGYMLLLLFWEMTSISSFLLIGWERSQPGAVRNAMQAFVVTAAGGLAMMGGLILIGVHTDAWSFSELRTLSLTGQLHVEPLLVAGFVLVFVGAAAKSAQWPLHFWLPGAMAAPTPVSAYLHSATMVKAGVYLTGRLWPILAVLPAMTIWPALIVPLGAFTMVLGAFIAIQKDDLKQIFAYTTVSQLGLLMCMYGLSAFEYGHAAVEAHGGAEGHAPATAIPNLIWDVTQILNHALYKAPLFILAGAIGHVASRNLSELRGFVRRGTQPLIMTVVILLAGYALAAGPFTVSFTAKEMFFYQIYHAKASMPTWGFWLLAGAGVATGTCNVAIFIRLATTLLGKPREEQHTPMETVAPHGNGDDHSDTHDAHHDARHTHTAHHAAHAAHAHHGHADHAHETGFWSWCLWLPGLALVAFQYVGGLVPGAWDKLFGWLEASPFYFDHFPMTWDAHPGMPLYMSLCAIGLGILIGFAPILRRIVTDPHDKLYPAFYTGVTKIIGPRTFGVIQSGHATAYVALVLLAFVGLFAWSVGWGRDITGWPASVAIEHWADMLPGYLLCGIVCLTSLLMTVVHDRPARVLVLGSVGFTVTGLFYMYRAPDLALTQLSIEIVSLILFLLVLRLLPDQKAGPNKWVLPRAALSLLVGGAMFWLVLSSVNAPRPAMPYRTADGQRVQHLGHYFLRNSKHGYDALHMPDSGVYGGVVDRGEGHASSFGTGKKHHELGDEHEADAKPQAAGGHGANLHKGGGGANVVNVILVDFRGFDTMGEITVLGLAALGVWTLLRRHRPSETQALTSSEAVGHPIETGGGH